MTAYASTLHLWSPKHRLESCRGCGEKQKRHVGIGLCQRCYRMNNRYGLTADGYDGLMQKQNGRCSVCAEIDAEGLHVDHDHATGEVRGLLCKRCNKALGLFEDDTDRLRAAALYLEGRIKRVVAVRA